MRSKAIFSVIAFLAAFGISVALAPRASTPQPLFLTSKVKRYSADRQAQQKITDLLAQDVENGRLRDRDIEDISDLSGKARFKVYVQMIGEYADASAGLDDSSLPADFQNAWREHMNVWREHADFLNEVSESGIQRSEYLRRTNEQNREISMTWIEVLHIANEYGAEIPAGAY